MARISFTLAALATSAVSGVSITGAREVPADGDFTIAQLQSNQGTLWISVPTTQSAEIQQSAELLSLAALTAGARARLPFAVPEVLGVTRAGDTRAVVTTAVDGDQFRAQDLSAEDLLLQPLAEALAAIHALPASVAQLGGLKLLGAREARAEARHFIAQVEATRLLPETIAVRWKHAIDRDALWDFAPTVVHGELAAESFRVADNQVSAVLGWSGLSVGDPALDFAWLFAAGAEVCDTVMQRYCQAGGAAALAGLRVRAQMYHEFQVAQWLLHGVSTHDDAIIADAVAMFDHLVDTVRDAPDFDAVDRQDGSLSEESALALLEEVPEVSDRVVHEVADEALDEDRMFGYDTDFIEPLPAQSTPPSETSDRDAAVPAEWNDDLSETAQHTDVLSDVVSDVDADASRESPSRQG